MHLPELRDGVRADDVLRSGVTELVVAPVAHPAVVYAVTHWHYSGVIPAGKRWARGVWEDGRFVGVVVFGRGGSRLMSQFWGLKQTECVELTRIALREHEHPVSEIVAIALAELHESNPGLRLVVSYADPAQAHHGGVYQAGNWLYTGLSEPNNEVVIHGRQTHKRVVGGRYGFTNIDRIRAEVDPNAIEVAPARKFRYVMPLDRGMRRQVLRMDLDSTPPGPLDAPVPAAFVRSTFLS